MYILHSWNKNISGCTSYIVNTACLQDMKYLYTGQGEGEGAKEGGQARWTDRGMKEWKKSN